MSEEYLAGKRNKPPAKDNITTSPIADTLKLSDCCWAWRFKTYQHEQVIINGSACWTCQVGTVGRNRRQRWEGAGCDEDDVDTR